MNPKWVVASGLLTMSLLGGCPNPNRAQRREATPQPAPQAMKSTPAPLSAPAASASSHPVTEGRLVDSGLIIETFAGKFGRKGLQQVPSEVIDNGILRYVPYLSYEAEQYQLNIYGDPQHPAAVEIGVYAGKDGTKQEVRSVMAGLLQKAADREVVHGLALEKDQLERAGLTFEVTPPTADDAFGGWWISIYDKSALDKARASTAEMKTITVSVPQPKPESAPHQERKKVKRAKKPAGGKKTSDRVYIEDYTKKDGAYVNPAL
ncbi:hypothetical protein JQX13_21900 [Archangium violaceum]|uniref:hypothetical protein n=1 Tax=Archangium violaceum TaxID=83451 RepID=UPI00193B443B|nr:hypothetical protein [Archangium violaceum]QRK12444.1 hypothetical protein JQX13_21900 [Archangium violaceum]